MTAERFTGTREEFETEIDAMREKFREWYKLSGTSDELPLYITDDAPVTTDQIADMQFGQAVEENAA